MTPRPLAVCGDVVALFTLLAMVGYGKRDLMRASGGAILGYAICGGVAGLVAAVLALIFGAPPGLAVLVHATVGSSLIFCLALRVSRPQRPARELFPDR
ncbi:MAG: hypothetical protein MUF74_04675 [Cypionkella sp.]|jgi:hypothetical protein|nr:hypothetical protein [Cypionkella sp.]